MASTPRITIDPTQPFGPQKIGATFSVPIRYLNVLRDVAYMQRRSFSSLVVSALEEYAENHDIELPGAQTWEVQKSA